MGFTPFTAAEGRRNLRTAVMVAGIAMLVAGPAWAAGGGTAMPWETPLETIMQSLSGPVAKAVGSLAIAFTATTFITSFFNMTAGAAF